MATLVVQSRFAGLNIEDDDFSPAKNGQKSKKNKQNTAASSATSTNTKKSSETAKKPKTNNQKPQTASQKKKKSKSATGNAEQWEQWKQKDAEFVDGNFEDELHQAILLSKLEYEEKKDVYKQLKKDAENEKKAEQSKLANKKKKKHVMSLEQFISGKEEDKIQNNNEDSESSEDIPQDKEFFESIKCDTKNELLKDKVLDRVRTRVTEEVLNRVQFADALERKDKEIAKLTEQVASLKEELITVKTRNKKLCNLLASGEMRDKAEVLVEAEKLRQVQQELTAEVAALHMELERERSKNTDVRAKDKKKKGGSADKEK